MAISIMFFCPKCWTNFKNSLQPPSLHCYRPGLPYRYMHNLQRAMSTVPVKRLRGVVFDMDGTLTVPNLDFTEMYRRCNVPVDPGVVTPPNYRSPSCQFKPLFWGWKKCCWLEKHPHNWHLRAKFGDKWKILALSPKIKHILWCNNLFKWPVTFLFFGFKFFAIDVMYR